MKKRVAETNSKGPNVARRDFVKTTTAAGVGLLIVPSVIALGSTANSSLGPDIIASGQSGSKIFTKECDIGQGYNFKPDVHRTFGYINAFMLGDNDIAPDIKVVDPTAINKTVVKGSAGTTGGATANMSGIFTKPVVCVLSNATWSTLPNENITFQGRISISNAQTLRMLTMQSLKRVTLALSFVVYEYDLVNQLYFTSFKSFKGAALGGVPAKPGGSGFGTDPTVPPIYALLGKTSGTEFGLKIGSKAEEDPLGIRNHTLELTLAPPIAKEPQQILIQTSEKIKLIQPWGLPQK